MGVWHRGVGVSSDYQVGQGLLTSLNSGNTILRCHFRWGIVGDTGLDVDYAGISQNLPSAGIVTTIGNGTETAPNARTLAADQAPPTQRWLFWETRGIRPNYVESAAGVVGWLDTGATEPTDSRGQVLATGLPGGDTLNLWFTWAAPFAWDASGSVIVWWGYSVLTAT